MEEIYDRLANLLPRPLAQHLHRWVQGGPYEALFDNVEDMDQARGEGLRGTQKGTE